LKKILIVEDNSINMKLFCDILELQKYHTIKAFDGLDAFDKLLNDKYDLMILDIQLPKLDGFSLLKKLKDNGIEQPKTIIVSAFAMDKDKQKAKELGCNDYITKPIDIMGFISKVKTTLGEQDAR